MSLRHVTVSPKATDFTPLQEHQEQTPDTFFGGKPVLYATFSGLTISAPSDKFKEDVTFAKFATEEEAGTENLLVKDVDIWVNSEDVTFFQQTPNPTGLSIPYPSIALHATMKWKSQVDALFMNILLNDMESVNADEDIQVVELTVLPPDYSSAPQTTCIKEIYSAMNVCADLHPDQDQSGEEEGDFEDETAPGASGWITAENMHEYVDENGNFRGQVIGGDDLGPGAGTVRPREDGEDNSNGVNGDGHENKYYRTD